MGEKSKFFKVWRICVISFAVLLAAGLVFLYFWLDEYEQSQPLSVAKNYGQAVFAEADGEELLKNCKEISQYETAQTVSSWLGEKTKDGVNVVSSSAKKDGYDASFSVQTKGETVATLYLKRKAEKSLLGNRGYDVGTCEINKELFNDITVQKPQNAVLSIGGKKVEDAQVVKETAVDLSGSKIAADSIFSRQTVKISGILGNPEITATIDGKSVDVNKEDGIYSIMPTITEQEKKDIESVAVACTTEYAKYMQWDVPFSSVAKYLKPNTDFYYNVKSSLVIFALIHDEDIIKTDSVTDFYKYSDSIYSCRVKLVQTMKIKANNKVFVDNMDKDVFLIKENGKFKVLDIQNHSEG